jgi:hypothetical protein
MTIQETEQYIEQIRAALEIAREAERKAKSARVILGCAWEDARIALAHKNDNNTRLAADYLADAKNRYRLAIEELDGIDHQQVTTTTRSNP